MNWLAFSILSYLLLGLHLGLRPFIAWNDAMPNIVLAGVVFFAINASREPALLACFLLGALQDLFTQSPMGLNAFGYGLAAMYVVANQRLVSRDHFLTHFYMTLAAGVIAGIWFTLHHWLYYKLHPLAIQVATPAILPQLVSILYSATLAILLLAILQRTKRLFTFKQAQSSINLRTRDNRLSF